MRWRSVKFFYGPMDCGKSTLALQIDHNHARQGRHGLLLIKTGPAQPGQITSRMGFASPAIEVSDDLDLTATDPDGLGGRVGGSTT